VVNPVEFSIVAGIVAGAEYLLYRYSDSSGKFRVSPEESSAVLNRVQEIGYMKPEEMMKIMYKVREELAEECRYQPVKHALKFVFGLSDDISDLFADRYGTRLSEESKGKIDASMSEFARSYSKGWKVETYDSIARVLQGSRLFRESREIVEKIDRIVLARELQHIAAELSQGKASHLYDILSNYSQRPIEDPDVLVFINTLNDVVYRTKSRLDEGPSYYHFLREISKDITQASRAVRRGDSQLLYESYEGIFNKASARVTAIGGS
jgi:hypothetical protein